MNKDMLRIDLPTGRRVGLQFSYPLISVKVKKDQEGGVGSSLSLRAVRCTVYEILLAADGTERLIRTLTEGVATCHSKDRFVKETGRNKALRHAVLSEQNLLTGARYFVKEERKVIWDAWRGRPRPITTPKGGVSSSDDVDTQPIQLPAEDTAA